MPSISAFLEGREPNGRLTRGRDYSDPIDDMVKAIPPGTPLTPDAITRELYDARYSLALINASIGQIMVRINENCAHSARAVGEK